MIMIKVLLFDNLVLRVMTHHEVILKFRLNKFRITPGGSRTTTKIKCSTGVSETTKKVVGQVCLQNIIISEQTSQPKEVAVLIIINCSNNLRSSTLELVH